MARDINFTITGADFSFRSVELIDAIFDMIKNLKEKGVI